MPVRMSRAAGGLSPAVLPRGSRGRILLAILDPTRAGLVAHAALDLGLLPTLAFTPRHLLSCLDVERFDLVVLDLRLAGSHPQSLLQVVTARSDAALLAVGGEGAGLESLLAAGAHEQVPGDTAPQELATRGAALLGLRGLPEAPPMIRWGPLKLDLDRREARWSSRPVHLTPLELRILLVLALARGAVVTTPELGRLVWRSALALDEDRVFAHIRRMRKKIEPDPSHPRFLLTVRGEGFRLADGGD